MENELKTFEVRGKIGFKDNPFNIIPLRQVVFNHLRDIGFFDLEVEEAKENN